jgi:hypothetical protein
MEESCCNRVPCFPTQSTASTFGPSKPPHNGCLRQHDTSAPVVSPSQDSCLRGNIQAFPFDTKHHLTSSRDCFIMGTGTLNGDKDDNDGDKDEDQAYLLPATYTTQQYLLPCTFLRLVLLAPPAPQRRLFSHASCLQAGTIMCALTIAFSTASLMYRYTELALQTRHGPAVQRALHPLHGCWNCHSLRCCVLQDVRRPHRVSSSRL